MHRHRDKNGTAPFVGNGETTSQNEQGSERREMSVRGGEKQRVEGNSEKTAEITFEYAVEETPKKIFFNDWCDRHPENDNHDSLFERARAIEKRYDALLAGAVSASAPAKSAAQQQQTRRRE